MIFNQNNGIAIVFAETGKEGVGGPCHRGEVGGGVFEDSPILNLRYLPPSPGSLCEDGVVARGLKGGGVRVLPVLGAGTAPDTGGHSARMVSPLAGRVVHGLQVDGIHGGMGSSFPLLW